MFTLEFFGIKNNISDGNVILRSKLNATYK